VNTAMNLSGSMKEDEFIEQLLLMDFSMEFGN
jgi:hypothetical protein